MSRWPDPERPGVPPEHDRDGVWFLRLPPAPEPEPMIWTPPGRNFSLGYWTRLGHDEVIVAPSEFLPGRDYAAAEFHGAGLTPAEAQALAAERDALREAVQEMVAIDLAGTHDECMSLALEAAYRVMDQLYGKQIVDECAAAIRARGDEGR